MRESRQWMAQAGAPASKAGRHDAPSPHPVSSSAPLHHIPPSQLIYASAVPPKKPSLSLQEAPPRAGCRGKPEKPGTEWSQHRGNKICRKRSVYVQGRGISKGKKQVAGVLPWAHAIALPSLAVRRGWPQGCPGHSAKAQASGAARLRAQHAPHASRVGCMCDGACKQGAGG